MLALVMAWNSFGVTEYQVHAVGTSEYVSDSNSQEVSASQPETDQQGVPQEVAEEDGELQPDAEHAQTMETPGSTELQVQAGQPEDRTEFQPENVTELQAEEEQITEMQGEQTAESGVIEETIVEDDADEQAADRMDMQAAEGQVRDELTGDDLLDEELDVYFADDDVLPATLDEITDHPKTAYSIVNPDDVYRLATFSKTYNFEGITLKFALVNNLQSGKLWKLDNAKFEGLGAIDCPFKGRLEEHYGNSSVKFEMTRPLFVCIGSGAGLVNFDINLTNNRFKSGLAEYYVVDSDEQVTFDNVVIKGGSNLSSGNNTGIPVGGLYGTIWNKLDKQEDGNPDQKVYEVKLDGKGVNVSGLYLWGKVVGGYVGRAEGNVKLSVSDGSKAAASVNPISVNGGYCAIGGLVGELTGGSTFTVTKEIKVSNSVIMNIANSSNYNEPDAVGGIVGLCQNGSQIISEAKVTRTTDMMIHNKYVGGYVGYVKNAKAVIRDFQLDAKVRMYNNYLTFRDRAAGGVVGYYEVTGEDHTEEALSHMGLEVSRIGISKQIISNGDDGWIVESTTSGYDNYRNHAGGVAGRIVAGESMVIIEDISSEGTLGGAFLPALQYDTHTSLTEKVVGSTGANGGLVGRLSGQNIVISNVTLRFNTETGLGGAYSGGLAGYVDRDTAIYADNIAIKAFFQGYALARDYRKYKVGGLFGYVLDGSIIRLGGIVDLEAIGKSSFSDDRVGSYSNWDYRKWGNRGYIAGYQNESLIYLDTDAVYKRGKDVEATEWYEDESWETNEYWNSNFYYPGDSNKGYVIDDIGTYGGLYRNVMDGEHPVIDYGSRKLSGTVEKATDGRYQIRGLADALRMAVALNTFVKDSKALRFGAGECFGGAELTAEELLAADYTVTDDLNLADAGIYSLVRNDGVTPNATPSAFGGTSFRGSLWGALKADNSCPTITLSIFSRQEFGGLFPCVDGGNGEGKSFKNLNLAGHVYFNHSDHEQVSAAGGLAAYATGSISLDNVNILLKMKTGSYQYNYSNYYAGGLFGRYDLKEGQVFSYINGKAAPVIGNVRTFQVAGGLVGCLITEKKKAENENVILENIELGAQMKTPARMNRNNSYYMHSKMSALISYMGWTELRNYMQGSSYMSTTDVSYGEPTTKVRLNGITADGVNLTCTTDWNGNQIRCTGGLLGYEWNNAQIRMLGETKVKNCFITGNGHMGGLFSTLACSSFDMTADGASIDLESLTMQNNSPSWSWTYSSFLIGDGRYALVNLNVGAYHIGEGTTCSRFTYFDEIVGISYALASNNINDYNAGVTGNYNNGGLVNLVLPAFSEDYTTYKNQVITMVNKYTRYYYNLFNRPTSSPTVHVTDSETEIACEEDLLIWHAYFNSGSQIRSYMRDYFDADPKWSFKVTTSKLDMKYRSFYPTCVNQGSYDFGSVALILDGLAIETKEKSWPDNNVNRRCPYLSDRQHYLMHAGIFYNISGTVSINGGKNDTASTSSLTLQGTCTFPQYYQGGLSGALVAGSLTGICYMNHVVCDGIRVAGYTTHGQTGLLVGNVAENGTLFMNDIMTTERYEQIYNAQTTSTKYVAASSLIGRAGGATIKKVHVEFYRMQVGGLTTEEGFAPGSLNNKRNYVFHYASYIDYYDSTDNADLNRSMGLYRFTKADFDANRVTFGWELKYGVNYADQERNDALQTVIDKANQYLPYVRYNKTVMINPASGNLNVGCGTYEDPYQISSTMQFIMLCAYLNSGDSGDSKFNALNEGAAWKVNRIGGATGHVDRCRVKFGETEAHQLVGVGEEGFPGKDGLRKAYYQIAQDIDMSSFADLNEYVLMSDFSGLGTAQYPFSGVIVGKEVTEEAVHRHTRITLPASTNDWEYYGLIQYMKGAVVKDLDICFAQKLVTDSDDSTTVRYVKLAGGGTGGGVAAVVLGGDNIIDDVKIESLEFQLENNNYTSTTGGYAGLVKAGSLIVRNITADHINGYNSRYSVSSKTGRIRANMDNYQNFVRNSQIVGWVEDGCVIYEDTEGENAVGVEKQVLERAEFRFPTTETVGSGESEQVLTLLPLSYSFPMINGNYLAAQCAASKIEVSGSADQTNGFKINIHNSAQLEIVALALNQGAFSIQDTGRRDKTNSYAYDYTAVCRKASYGYIGLSRNDYDDPATPDVLDTLAGNDFAAATGQDDGISYDPYVCRNYMTFTTTGDETEQLYLNTMKLQDETVDGKSVTTRSSYLNWLTWAATNDEKNLTGGDVYSAWGVGKILTTYVLDENGEYDLSVFGRSFRGFGELYGVDSVTYDGTTVTRYNPSRFRANFDGQNASVRIHMVRDWDATNVKTVGMFNDLTTDRQPDKNMPEGQIDEGGFEIKNLRIVDSTFDSETVAGAMAGAIAGNCRGIWRFEKVSLEGTGETADKRSVVQGRSHAGGLIGQIRYYYTTSTQSVGEMQKISFQECAVKGDTAGNPCLVSGSFYAGGLVGWIEGLTSNPHTHFGKVRVTDCQVKNTDVMVNTLGGNDVRLVGGLFGRIGCCYDNQNNTYNDGNGQTFGVVEILQTNEDGKPDKTIENVRLGSNDEAGNALRGAGGLVGMYISFYTNSNRTDNYFRVKGVRIDHLQVNGRTSYLGGKYAVGGVAGTVFTNRLFVEDVQVTNSTIGTADLTQPADNSVHARVNEDEITGHASEYRLNVGGIVGLPYVHYAHITKTKVQDCYLETYGGAAGGFIGDSQCRTALQIGTVDFKEENGKHLCTVCGYIDLGEGDISGKVISQGNTVRSWAGAAGGIVGYNSPTIGNYPTWTFRGIDVKGCTVYSAVISDTDAQTVITTDDNYAAGGILGRTDRYFTAFNLKDIRVGDGCAVAGVHAGGLIGRVSNGYTVPMNLDGDILVGCSHNVDPETGEPTTPATYSEDAEKTAVFALKYAGGLYGWHQSSGEEKSQAVVRVCGLRIGCYDSVDDGSEAAAGGIAGKREISGMVKYDEGMAVENCVFAVNHVRSNPLVAAGGIYGVMTGTNTAYLYRPELKNNSVGFMDGLKSVAKLRSIGSAGGDTDSDKLKLLYNDGDGLDKANAKIWNEVKDSVTEDKLGDYAIRFGNYIGYSTGGVFYALRPSLTFDNNTVSRPVTDVGNESRQATNYDEEYGYGYPYAWRKNCHIIYLDGMENAVKGVIPDSLQLTVNGAKVPGHLFEAVDTIAGQYSKDAKGDTLINNYRLHAKMDGTRYIFSPDGGGFKETSYYTKTFTDDTEAPYREHLVFDGIVPQTAIDSIIGILTNMGGVIKPSGTEVNNAILKITAVRAKINNNGTMEKLTSGTASLKVVGNRYVQNEPNVYDDIDKNDQSRTITLLQILYSWEGIRDKKQKAEVLYIPVCVMQRVDLYSDLHIMEGERYALTDANNEEISLTSDNTTLKLSHNSTFTLFSEFGYSDGRKKEDFQGFEVVKTLTFERFNGKYDNKGNAIWEYADLPVGLRLTLLDVQTNRAYYYQIAAEDNADEKKGRIDFTSFLDDDNKPLVTRKLSEVMSSTSYQYRNRTSMKGKDFGVEQFFIYVDSTDVKDMEAVIYKVHVDTGKTAEASKNFIDNTESGGIEINWDAGLEIQFYDKKEKRAESASVSEPVTSVTGAISRTESLKINTRFAITAHNVYWDEKATAGTTYIDSINNGKYLDIAVYLYDSSMKQVPFPSSTTVFWTGPDGEKEQKTITQETVLYGYKEWGGTNYDFQIANVSRNIVDAETIQVGAAGVNVSNECHLELDFSTANLDDYIGNTYNVVVELRRSSDPAYPLGGDVVDETTGSVQCTGNKEYAVAMAVDNSLNLGINTYNQTETVHKIPFQTKLDFSGWIINHRDADITRCADKNYRVTYRLKRKEKTPGGGGYVYNSVDKGVAAKRLGRAFRLLLTDSEGNASPQTLELKKYGTGENEEWVYQTVMQFSKKQIVDGDGTGIIYVTGWNAVLSVDTEELEDEDYSNYQLEVTILPYDKTLTADQIPVDDTDLKEGEKAWSDYYIFTIARLKTDI